MNTEIIVENLNKLGGNYATTNKFRHPTQKDFIKISPKGRDLLDIEKISPRIENTLKFVEECGEKGQVILFVSSRHETLDIVKKTAESLSLPFMTVRWIGGTLSNFRNIRSRVEKMIQLDKDKDTGGWSMFTKKEIVLLNRKLEKLRNRFGGIENLERMPAAIFIIDTKRENIATNEANNLNIPVIGCSNVDADLKKVQYPIIVNISSSQTMKYIIGLVEDAYRKGVESKK